MASSLAGCRDEIPGLGPRPAPAPATAEPAPANPAPTPVNPEPANPAPTKPEPAPAKPEPAPAKPEPGPAKLPAPAEPAPAPGKPPPNGEPRARRWVPVPGSSWQWQLTGPVDESVDAAVYELDAFDTEPAVVARLHAAGRRAICYVDAGTYEDFRPDASRFPDDVLGKGNGWPGERWLDIRRWDVLAPVLDGRLGLCRAKGFDGVELDNVDGYLAPTGFPLGADDQLLFNRRLAELAHRHGLAAGLKNDVEQAEALEPEFDFAVNEECFAEDECRRLRPFVAAGKAVFHVEYDVAPAEFCPVTRALGFSSIRKRPDLDAWRQPC